MSDEKIEVRSLVRITSNEGREILIVADCLIDAIEEAERRNWVRHQIKQIDVVSTCVYIAPKL